MAQFTRREVLGRIGAAALGVSALPRTGRAVAADADTRPNVIFILVDDQGYGDLGCMGNTKLHTPHIDALFHESVWFPNFYVCPLCSPTRSSLMTGRYNYRTGIVDTSTGLSMMRRSETTVAEILSQAGYRTGIFSKWHLGDHYPLRPNDKGFEESLICKDAIVAGIANAPGNSLFSPILYHNNTPVRTHGYITDVSFDATMRFIEESHGRPFFVYLATNVVHEPLQVASEYSAPFKAMGLDDYTATLYGEVVNLDQNVGRLRARLEQLGLARNTILMYLSDNGPSGPPRYNLGLRRGKGSVYEGGIKVPYFAYWSGKLPAGRKCEQIAAHIDILPTLLEMCGVEKPPQLQLDGRSLLPLMTGAAVEWPARNLFFQQSRPDRAHRVYADEPRLFTNCAARSQQYKIVMTASDPRQTYIRPVSFGETELYDIEQDPGEKNNVARHHPQLVRAMRAQYEAWFRDVSRGIRPAVRNFLGSSHENPVTLTAQDLRGPRSARGPHMLQTARAQAQKHEPLGFGYWAVEVARDGRYKVTMQFDPPPVLGAVAPWRLPLKAGQAFLRIGSVELSKLIADGAPSVDFTVSLRAGEYFLNAYLTGQREDGIEVSPFYVVVEWLG